MNEYKKFSDLYYCYSSESDMTIRVDSGQIGDIVTYNFKLSDWDKKERLTYEKCTKKEFKMALNVAIKKLREVTK